MANRLVICVTSFTNLATNSTTYGYTAADDYAQVYENHWDSLEEFLVEVPIEEALVDRVLWSEGFQDFERRYLEDGNTLSNVEVDFPAYRVTIPE